LWSALPIEDLTEDLVQIQSMDGSRLVDVGWYPEMDPKGTFRCRLIANSDWQNPLEELRTREAARVRAWITDVTTRHSNPPLTLLGRVPVPMRSVTAGSATPNL